MARRAGRNRPKGQRRAAGGGNYTFSAEISDDGDVYDVETGDFLGNLSTLEQVEAEQPAQLPQANLLTASDPHAVAVYPGQHRYTARATRQK